MFGEVDPAHVDRTDFGSAVLNLLFAPVGLLAGLTLSLLAGGLSGGFLARWFMPTSLSWIVYAVDTAIEGAVFSTFAAVSLFTVVTFLGASLLCGATVAWLFPPATRNRSFSTSARTWIASHRTQGWLWRLGLAWLAFPVIYVTFGSLVAPFVIEVYVQQRLELTVPGWSIILITQAIRSVLFLVACLPILIAWQQTRRRLLVTLSWALFVFVGLLYMLQAYWMPLDFRLAHSLEILADSYVYAWALVVLFRAREDTAQQHASLAQAP